MKTTTAGDIMNPEVITVRDDMPVQELADLFSERSISGAPVLNQFDRLVGVVSATDIVRAGAQQQHVAANDLTSHYYLYGWDTGLAHDDLGDMNIVVDDGLLVRDIMTPTIFGVPRSATIGEMADTMLRGRIHRLIVTENDQVVGIVTTFDMLQALRDRALENSDR